MSKKIKNILQYIGVALFFILAIGLRPFGVANFLFLALTLLMIPGISAFVFSFLPKGGTVAKWITIVALFITGSVIIPPQETIENTDSPEETSITSSAIIETDTFVDESTEVPTEAPPEALTEAPTEASTEVPTEALTEAPTEASTEVPTEAPTEAPIETVHTHSWIAATCTTPKTCSDCGETEGEAGGHAWRDATCTEAKRCLECDATEGSAKGHSFTDATCMTPKKCIYCDKTEGSALGHSYSSGRCTRCGSADPNYVEDRLVWIPTNGGTKYHSRSTCSQMEDPIQVTESEAINRGYGKCRRRGCW